MSLHTYGQIGQLAAFDVIESEYVRPWDTYVMGHTMVVPKPSDTPLYDEMCRKYRIDPAPRRPTVARRQPSFWTTYDRVAQAAYRYAMQPTYRFTHFATNLSKGDTLSVRNIARITQA